MNCQVARAACLGIIGDDDVVRGELHACTVDWTGCAQPHNALIAHPLDVLGLSPQEVGFSRTACCSGVVSGVVYCQDYEMLIAVLVGTGASSLERPKEVMSRASFEMDFAREG